MNQDTIAAVATAPGQGGVSIVRMSGPEAEQVRSCGIDAYYASSDGSRSFDEIQRTCREDLVALAARVLRVHLTNA